MANACLSLECMPWSMDKDPGFLLLLNKKSVSEHTQRPSLFVRVFIFESHPAMLKAYSWWVWGNHVWFWGLNSGWTGARQASTRCTITLAPSSIIFVPLPAQNLVAFQIWMLTLRTFSLSLLHLSLQCLCLAPTYELALQTGSVVERMGKFCVDVQVMYAIRGNRSMYQ